MPRATISQDTIHKDLNTAPPDGFVELRRLPYGEWLNRQSMAMSMKVSQDNTRKGFGGEIEMMQREVAEFEFANCVVSHNLEEENGELIDFKNRSALARLDPKIGNEISQYITELHEFDMGNSQNGSGGSLEVVT